MPFSRRLRYIKPLTRTCQLLILCRLFRFPFNLFSARLFKHQYHSILIKSFQLFHVCEHCMGTVWGNQLCMFLHQL